MSTRGKKGWILAFSLPCLVLFCLVYAIPFVMVITTSFCDYSLTQSPVFEGLKNFKTIFADPDFSVLLNPSFGVIKIIYEKFGLDTTQVLNLFGNSKYAFMTVTATWVFYSGFNMLIFMGEMGAISPDIYEAAMVDGATPAQADRYITIPLMKNAFGTCVVLASVAMVSQFDIIYMTTKGGPGNATLNLPTYLYKIITLENNYGKANAVGVIQIALGLVLVILIQKLFNQKQEMKEV